MTLNIKSYMMTDKTAHLIGIGGVSMSPLAEVLVGMGLTVTGSDMKESDAVAHLRGLGITVQIGHDGPLSGCADFIIRTAAVHDDNPEIILAHSKSIPVFERAQAWGAIMQDYKHALCISGTHGKTTTTSMATHITMVANLDPSIMIGGALPLLGAGHRVGKGDTIVLESCEYCNSFHSFFPTVAVILNVEADHLDFFKDLADVEQSFRTFANRVPDHGYIVANGEDENTMHALAGITQKVVTFGVDTGDVHAENLEYQRGFPTFDVIANGEFYAHVALQVPGIHNVKNALAAAASAYVMGIDGQAVAEGLDGYLGVGRRFEFKGTFNGADVYDDYAHHPGELAVLLATAKTLGYHRVICAFQPHTYTRTTAFFQDFVTQLSNADVTLVSEIYAAREINTTGISSKDLVAEIPDAIYCATLADVEQQLRSIAQPGDLILTVGAGDIVTVGQAITS